MSLMRLATSSSPRAWRCISTIQSRASAASAVLQASVAPLSYQAGSRMGAWSAVRRLAAQPATFTSSMVLLQRTSGCKQTTACLAGETQRDSAFRAFRNTQDPLKFPSERPS